MRKADIAGMDLDGIYESLLGFKGYGAMDLTEAQDVSASKAREAVVTICSTGQGAALKLKELVENILHHTGRPIEVVPIGLSGMEERIEEIQKEYKVI